MRQFLKLTGFYFFILILLLFIGLEISSSIVKNRHFKNYETESNLLVMDTDEQFDILFMGISHARNFSRYKNHLRIEDILDKKILNIGQGNGQCGVNEQLFYLDYFYSKENTASTVVYVISPPLFFSETLPLASNTFAKEPFELSFFGNYLFFKTENKQERLTDYLQTKLNIDWLSYKPNLINSKTQKLDSIDNNIVNAGQKSVYKDSISLQRFNKSVDRFEETIQLALENKSNVVLVIPPALFGKWKGHSNVEEFAKQMDNLEGVKYYDFSESVLLPEYYYDHHHLNTDGVIYFTENYLKPIFNNDDKALTCN